MLPNTGSRTRTWTSLGEGPLFCLPQHPCASIVQGIESMKASKQNTHFKETWCQQATLTKGLLCSRYCSNSTFGSPCPRGAGSSPNKMNFLTGVQSWALDNSHLRMGKRRHRKGETFPWVYQEVKLTLNRGVSLQNPNSLLSGPL